MAPASAPPCQQAVLQTILGVFTFATAWVQQPTSVDTVFSIMAGLVAVIGERHALLAHAVSGHAVTCGACWHMCTISGGCIGIHGARQARKPNPTSQDRGRGELVFFGLIEVRGWLATVAAWTSRDRRWRLVRSSGG